MGLFAPHFEGEWVLPGLPEDFVARLAERVERGLFVPGSRARANYQVLDKGRDRIAFHAADWLTALAVGLNTVRIRRVGREQLQYSVSLRRWNRYGVLLGLAVALPLAAGILLSNAGPVVAWLAWAQIVFWGVLWPWILTALHKPVARRTLESVVRQALFEEELSAVVAARYEYRSGAAILGIPLVHVAIGRLTRGHARGIVAVGDTAVGVLAVGGVSAGLIGVGGLSFGLVAALGGVAVGGAALAGLAVGGVAWGGLALGGIAYGGVAFGAVAKSGIALSSAGAAGVIGPAWAAGAAGGGLIPPPAIPI